MLYQLQNYALAQGIVPKYGFAHKTWDYTVMLNDDGDFLGLVKGEFQYRVCPDLSQPDLTSGGSSKSHFLIDTVEIVTGASTDDKKIAKHENFKALLLAASHYNDRLKVCYDFLNDENKRLLLQEQLKIQKAKATEKLTFEVGGMLPVEQTDWHDWWQGYKKTLKNDKKKKSRYLPLCLLTGEPCEPLATHDKVQLSTVGGLGNGSTVIGFDKQAFTSYGLKQGENAPLSQYAVNTYITVLKELIRNAPRPICGMYFLHGYTKPIKREDDPVFGFFDGQTLTDQNEAGIAENAFRNRLDSIAKGERPELLNDQYFVYLVSGSAGRMVLRGYLQGDVRELVQNMQKWFDDLKLILPKGGGTIREPKLNGLLSRLVSYREGEGVNKLFDRVKDEVKNTMPLIWRSILKGNAIPDTVAKRALTYIRSRFFKSEDMSDIQLDPLAVAWLKIWINRKERIYMGEALNKDYPSVAYQAGRLLSVLGRLQESALNGVNAGVVQRYYMSASTTPNLVLGRLIGLSNHHLEKLDPGLAYWYRNQITEIMSHIQEKLPSMFSLEEQSLFAIGYYHQTAERAAGKEKNEAAAQVENEKEESVEED